MKEMDIFSIREFKYTNNSNLINTFMQSVYFCWNEEFRHKVKVDINNKSKFVNWNFHGLYDIKKINANNFIETNFSNFKTEFLNILKKESNDKNKISEVERVLNHLDSSNSDFFIIQNLSNSFHHDWTVFDFFKSGFKIDKSNQVLTAIECGLD